MMFDNLPAYHVFVEMIVVLQIHSICFYIVYIERHITLETFIADVGYVVTLHHPYNVHACVYRERERANYLLILNSTVGSLMCHQRLVRLCLS